MTKKILTLLVFLALVFLFSQKAYAFPIEIDILKITRQMPNPPPPPPPPTKPEPSLPPSVPTQSPWPSSSPTPGPSSTPISSPTPTPESTNPPGGNGGNGGSSGGGGGVGGTSTGVLGASTLGDTGGQEDLLATIFIFGCLSLGLGMRKLYAFKKTS